MNLDSEQKHDSNSKSPKGFRTHGEKMYDLVFNQGINFWANLIISAGFTYWVNHSRAPIMKTPPNFAKWLGKAPIHAQNTVRNGIHDLPFMSLFGNKMSKTNIERLDSITNTFGKGETIEGMQRIKVAKFMADALTLTSAGTFVMIPGVWGAQKFKGDFVRWQDKMHYGPDAMDQEWVQERHDKIDHEKRPTMLGYTVGRLGSMAAVQATAYTVGHGDMIKWIGKRTPLKFLEKFEGVDHFAGSVGDALGGSAAKMMRKFSRSTNEHLVKSKMEIDWSIEQQRNAHKVMNKLEPLDGLDADEISTLEKQAKRVIDPNKEDLIKGAGRETAYNRAFEDFGKYVGLDTMYTAITAGTIVPFVGWLKDNVPGMAYTVEPKRDRKETPQSRVQATSVARDATVETAELKAAR